MMMMTTIAKISFSLAYSLEGKIVIRKLDQWLVFIPHMEKSLFIL